MQRVLRLGCLVLVVVGFCSRPAEAGLLDWLEELSGPGPFYGDVNFMGTICPPTRMNTVWLRTYDATTNKPCIFLDFRRFENNGKNKDRDNFRDLAEVGVKAYDFGPTWEVRRPVDVGFGAGIIHFTSKNFLGNKTGTTKATLTLARVQVKPVLFFRPAYWRENAGNWRTKLASVVKVYARESVILGTLDAEDFGVSPAQSSFRVKNDRVTSMGLLFDFTELLRRTP